MDSCSVVGTNLNREDFFVMVLCCVMGLVSVGLMALAFEQCVNIAFNLVARRLVLLHTLLCCLD